MKIEYRLLGKVLEILENDFTKGEIELTSFSIEKEHKEKLKELEDKKFFKKYNIFLGNDSFRIEAIPIKKDLLNNLLMFDRLNNLFENIPIETRIGCGGGLFHFIYNKTDEDLLEIKIEPDFSKEELIGKVSTANPKAGEYILKDKVEHDFNFLINQIEKCIDKLFEKIDLYNIDNIIDNIDNIIDKRKKGLLL